MKKKKNNFFILVFFLILLVGIAILFKSEPLKVYAYNMIISQEIIDNDLLLDKSIGRLDDVSVVRRINELSMVEGTMEIYEPTSIDEAKEIITYTPKIEKVEKPQYFFKRTHIVKEGESIWSISKNYDISLETLLSFNNIKKNIITVGQKLIIPSMDGILTKVEKNDTIQKIAKRFNVKENAILKANRLKSGAELKVGQEIFIPGSQPRELARLAAQEIRRQRRQKTGVSFIWPAASRNISSYYGWRIHPIYNRQIFHQGLDISGPIGTKIYAAEEGRVYFRDYITGYGKVVIIKHNQGYSTVYAHLSRFNVKVGQWVEQGEVIGYMGMTGKVTGSHLHFEVRRWDKHLDPLKILVRR
ncbi:MAG TPA: M23 family metallopeptidase [bacterium]|nr:M23 family metallopeptidase [bacterium]